MQDLAGYNIGVVRWSDSDEISEMISYELDQLGHHPEFFKAGDAIPVSADIIFSFAPYGNFIQIPLKFASIPANQRPILIHWNTEGIPDPRIPWLLIHSISGLRSFVGRKMLAGHRHNGNKATKFPYSWESSRMLRFRYVGDYYYAFQNGLLDIFADSSQIYAGMHRQHGLPTSVMPWGATDNWHKQLNLERDIDVLWMGQRGSKRRSDLLDRVRADLKSHGVNIHVADNEENPFIFGDERIQMLNRAKITLNLTRTWYDDNFSRFAMAAPNRSLIVSEPLLPHCPQYHAGIHYVSAPIEQLAQEIVYYLQQEEERATIVENAYQLVTQDLSFRTGIKSLIDQVTNIKQNRQ